MGGRGAGMKDMNYMKDMKHFSGCWHTQKKNKVFYVFFLFCIAKKAEIASFCFMKFINLVIRHDFRRLGCNFMNYMKMYEGGVFMANFTKAAFLNVFFSGFMKL